MGLSARGKKLIQCGIELLDVKEMLLDLSSQETSTAQELRLARLERRKKEILDEINTLSDTNDPPEQIEQRLQ